MSITKWYIGQAEENGRWEVFGADDPADATPEASGYENGVDGPFDTLEEAKAAAAE